MQTNFRTSPDVAGPKLPFSSMFAPSVKDCVPPLNMIVITCPGTMRDKLVIVALPDVARNELSE